MVTFGAFACTKNQSPLIGGDAKEGENQLPKPEDELPDFCYGWKEHGIEGDAVTLTQYHVNDFNLVFRSMECTSTSITS